MIIYNTHPVQHIYTLTYIYHFEEILHSFAALV